MKKLLIAVPLFALSGCTDGGLFGRSEGTVVPIQQVAPQRAPAPVAGPSPARTPAPARSPAPVATASAPPADPAPESEPVELASLEPAPGTSTPAPAASGRLGTTVASLGDPAEPGFWLKTPLVGAPQSGSVEYSGKTVSVQLIPAGSAGGGSQISLSAMRLLDAPLTDLPTLTVFAN